MSPFLSESESLCQAGSHFYTCRWSSVGKWKGRVTWAFTTPEGISLSLKLPDKNRHYISDSAWSLRARRPPKEPGRTHIAKASSNTTSFFINISLIICLLFLHDPANILTAIAQVEMAVMRLNELCMRLPLSLFSLGFSALLSFVFSLLHIKLSFIMLFSFFFFSQPNASFRGRCPHNYLRLQPMEKLWVKKGKQSQVR